MRKYIKFGIVNIIAVHLAFFVYSLSGSEKTISEAKDLYTSSPNCEIISYAQERNLTEIENVLKKGIDINCQNKFGRTALMIAAAHNSDAVMLLLNYGADPNLADHQGRTALMDAQQQSNISSMQYLIDAGADMEKKDFDMGLTVLMRACMSPGEENNEIVKLLLESGANPNTKDFSGETAVMIDIQYGGNNIDLLMKHGANINESGKHGETALTLVGEYGSTQTINKILGYKPDLIFLDPNKYNPLFSAVMNKNTEAIEVFVKAGLNINAVDKDGQNALLFAATYQKKDAVKKLVELGLNINSVDKSGRPFLSLMASQDLDYRWQSNEYSEMAKLFLQLGADINKRDNAGMTPLMHAAAGGNYKIFEVLVNAGADSSVKDPNGHTYSDYLSVSPDDYDAVGRIIKIAQGKNIISPEAIATFEARKTEYSQTTADTYDIDANDIEVNSPKSMADYIKTLDVNEIIRQNPNASPEEIAAFKAMIAKYTQMIADANNFEVNSPDFTAVYNNSPDINEIMTQNPDINARDEEGKTLLMRECEQGCNSETVKAILQAKADVNIRDNNDQSALMLAAKNCSPQTIKILIDTGADIKALGQDKKNLLMYSCQNTDANVADMFMRNFDINAKDKSNWTALMYAAQDSSAETVKHLINAGADVNAVSVSGRGALLNAIKHDNIAIMKLLVDAGVDVASQRSADEYKLPLVFAALYANKKETITFLVDQIAKNEKPDKYIIQALDWALLNYGYPGSVSKEVLDSLKELAAKTNPELYKKNLTNRLAEKARHVDNVKEIQELIAEGADPNGIDKSGCTVLMNAVENANPEIIQYLLKCKVNIDAVSDKGNTALHCAIMNSNMKVVKILIEAGANTGNKQLYSNLSELAVKKGNPEVIQFLKDRGLYNGNNIDNGKLLVEAAFNGDLALVKQLISTGAPKETLSNALLNAARVEIKLEMIQTLVNAGADVNIKNNWTVLMLLCGHSSTSAEAIQFLIDKGADINAKGNGKHTALLAAAGEGSPEVVKILVKAGANLEDKNFRGQTPLIMTIAGHKLKNFDMLISLGAKIDESNSYALLSHALDDTWGNKNMLLDKLLSAGVNINAVNGDGQSILIALCKNSSDASLIQFVLDNGADIKLQDRGGHDARYYLEKNTKLKNSDVFVNR